MKRSIHAVTASLVVTLLCSGASAYTVVDSNFVSFSSDGEPAANIGLSSFDTGLGTLQSVEIKLWHSGSIEIRVDNDDDYNTAAVQASMIRMWDLTGPGITTGGSKTITSAQITLLVDDGDDGVKDFSAPDGKDFSPLEYTDLLVGTYNPMPLSSYETAGPGTINLSVDPTTMNNLLNWVGDEPDQYQTDVLFPTLEVKAEVTYTYIPEPATAMLVLLPAAMIARRRR